MFAQQLKRLRQHKGLTQAQTAEKLGISKSAVSMYEQGRRYPDYHTLLGFAQLYGVTVDYLLTGPPEQDYGSAQEFASQVRSMLLGQKGLMFSGQPLSEKDIDAIVSAVQQGVAQVLEEKKKRAD